MKKIFIAVVISLSASALAIPSAGSVEDLRLELELYKARLPQLQQEIKELREASATNGQSSSAYDDYLKQVYAQDIRLHEQRLAITQWQFMVGNLVAGLVSLVTLSGLAFSGFQLWLAARPKAKISDNTVELEISDRKLRIQSSVIGIVVLVISCVFLLLFLKEVYQVRMA
jgi:hypothetical protein